MSKQHTTCLKHKHLVFHAWVCCLSDDRSKEIEFGFLVAQTIHGSALILLVQTQPGNAPVCPVLPCRDWLHPPGSVQCGLGAPRPPGTAHTAVSHHPHRRSRPSPHACGRRPPLLSLARTPASGAQCSLPHWPAASWAGSFLGGKAPCRVGRQHISLGTGHVEMLSSHVRLEAHVLDSEAPGAARLQAAELSSPGSRPLPLCWTLLLQAHLRIRGLWLPPVQGPEGPGVENRLAKPLLRNAG